MTEATALFTRSTSGAEVIESLIGGCATSIQAALYRFANPRIGSALRGAVARGVAVRVCLNYNDHYEENRAAQDLLGSYCIPFRIVQGKAGSGSKMHHKFAVFDGRTVATGSYNWTLESEERNYENLLVLGDAEMAAAYAEEFEALWTEGERPQEP